MVSKYYIYRNLKSLNQKYIRAKTHAEPLYYSKLAIIELCGWIEISIDEIIRSCSRALVQRQQYNQYIDDRVEKTYGFSEKKHLRPLINIIVGYNGLEKFEASADSSTLQALYRNLNELTTMRNNLAHTYIKGFTVTIESPQLIIRRFEQVASGLDLMEREIKKLSA